MKHIALIACVLTASLLPTAAFANDKRKDRENAERRNEQIIADRIAAGYTPDGRPIPRCYPREDNCAPRYDRYYRQDCDRDRDHGYRYYRGW